MRIHCSILVAVAITVIIAPMATGQDAAPADAPAEAAPPAPELEPQQVNVSVKVVEFQTTKGLETGLSAYFQRVNKERAYGRISSGNGAITTADLTFPSSRSSGITVFLDQLHMSEGDLEIVLQALAEENRAFVLSQPRALVKAGGPGTILGTVQNIPYENTQVVGSTAVQVTAYRDTGVAVNVRVPAIIDDDGDPQTQNDTYIALDLDAEVKEEGQRIVIALDDRLVGGDFALAQQALRAPELISRQIRTRVWVRHGQVLVIGGLYRNVNNKSLDTVPWLNQAEDVAVGLANRLIPGNLVPSPLSASIGNRSTEESRRELVFFIKAEVVPLSYTVMGGHGFNDMPVEERMTLPRPKDVITDVLEGSGELVRGIQREITGNESDDGLDLGGSSE